jgi:hypothetical protein
MDRDEVISYLLVGIGNLWMFGGLLMLQLLRAWGIVSPGVGWGLTAFYLVVLWIVALGALFFWLRSALRSGGLVAASLVILQVLMSCLIGVAFWRLLDREIRSWLFW